MSGKEARAKVEKAQRKAEQNKKKIIGWTQRGFTVIDVHYQEMHITVRWPKGQAEEMISAVVAKMARYLMVNPSIYDDHMKELEELCCKMYGEVDSTMFVASVGCLYALGAMGDDERNGVVTYDVCRTLNGEDVVVRQTLEPDTIVDKATAKLVKKARAKVKKAQRKAADDLVASVYG